MNNTKRILIVTHQFIPHQSPRTTRWKLLYDELIESGYDVTVITGTSQLSEDPNIKYIGNKKASGIVKNLRRFFSVFLIICFSIFMMFNMCIYTHYMIIYHMSRCIYKGIIYN